VGGLSVLLSSLAGAQDVDVPNNLTMMNSTDVTTGNVLKDGVPFMHNFGFRNTFLGSNAGNFTMSGLGRNAAIGVNALSNNTTGAGNVAIGDATLFNNTGGSGNIAIGQTTLFSNTIGNENTATGVNALITSTTGSNNTASGSRALFSDTSGSSNTAIGSSALSFNATGNNNTAVGRNALFGNNTGDNNTAVGSNADVLGDLTNATAVGAGAVVNASNKIRLGDTNVTVIEGEGDFHASGPGNGIILKSPDGLTCARISIDNSGQLVTTPLACP